jgi:hypothetical protein
MEQHETTFRGIVAALGTASMTARYQQHSLINGPRFETFLRDRQCGLGLARAWRLGLLRPAVIDGPLPERMRGYRFDAVGRFGADHDHFVDLSIPARTEEEIQERMERKDESFSAHLRRAWYHPFQAWQAYRLRWHLNLAVDPMTVFAAPDRYQEMIERARSGRLISASRWVSDWQFVDSFRMTTFLVTAAPLVMFRISRKVVSNPLAGESYEDYWLWRGKHEANDLMSDLGVTASDLRRWHELLAADAYRIDPLSSWFDLVQQVSWDKKERARNDVLLAHDFYVMAQIVRHYAADFLSVDLPEEDEVWHGPHARVVKENLYGTPKVTLADRKTRRRIAREFGVVGDERLVWYVEGETEEAFIDRYGDLQQMAADAAGITVVNLRGEGGLKSPGFHERLKVDGREERFTYVMVDGSAETKAALRRVSEEYLITAGYRIWDGDFESANFTDSELAEVVRRVAAEDGVDVSIDGDCISQARLNQASSEQAINQCLRGQHYRLPKGKRWGERLAEWAKENPCPEEKAVDGERPVVAVFLMCIRNSFADYLGSVTEYRVDPETGKIVERSPSKD